MTFINFDNATIGKLQRLAKEGLWVFVGQAGIGVAGLIGIKLLTHVLTPSEFGRLALANTIIALMGANFFGPLGQGLNRFWAISKDRGDLNLFYAVSRRLSNYIGIVAFLVTLLGFVILIVIKDFNWSVLITLASVTGIIAGLYSLRTSVFTAARQRKRTALLDISNTLFKPLLGTFLIIVIIANANIALIGYVIAALVILLIAEKLYLKTAMETSSYQPQVKTDVPLLQGLGREILLFSWPFIVWGMFGWIHMSCDRWSLQTFYGTEVVGAFAVVSQLAVYPLIFGSGFLSSFFMPIAFQKAGDLNQEHSKTEAKRIIIFMNGIFVAGSLLLILLFFLFHKELILLISNKHYLKFSNLLPWITVSWALFYLGQLLTQFGLLENKPQQYIFPKLLAALIAASLTFTLAPKLGPVGVVWGLGIAGFVYVGICSLIAIKLVYKNTIIQKNAQI